MNELEWLASADPAAMLKEIASSFPARRKQMTPFATDRQLRLFACACARQVWDLLTDPRSRRAVEVAERYADGEAALKEMVEVSTEADDAARVGSVEMCASWASWHTDGWVGRVFTNNGERRPWPDGSDATQAALLRCVVGNPWRHDHCRAPFHQLSSWLAWGGGTVPRLAQGIYDERAFDRLPILADALEEAGCTNADILMHCRGACMACTDKSGFCWGKVAGCRICNGTGTVNAVHARGCWVLDLLLGKQ